MLLAAGLAFPPAVAAQSAAKIPRVGLLHVGLDHVPSSLEALLERLRALGYEDGRTARLDWRNVADEAAALATARGFARDGADLIVAFENLSVRAAQAATRDIPIVMLHVTDPVSAGFVQSLARPGGNITGFAGLADLPAKRLELLRDFVPALRRVLLLVDPTNRGTPRQLAEVRQAGQALRLDLVERLVTGEAAIRQAFAALGPGEADAVFVVSPNLYLRHTRLIIGLAAERRLPLGWHRRFGAELGALFAYGPDYPSVGREAAEVVDRILKGARPADLPVRQLSRFELIVNGRAARRLGLAIPPSILLRADRVIE